MTRRTVTARLGRAVRALDRFGFGRLSRPARAAVRLVVSANEAEVTEVLDLLERAGVRVWVAGGWGVDALLGGRSRAHSDLDLVLDARDDHVDTALDALVGMGISYIDEDAVGGPWMPELVAVSDRAGRHVDLCPLDLQALPVEEPFARGTLAGRAVPCLSPALQVAFHRGYRQRPSQRSDLRRLCDKFGLQMPADPPGRIASAARRARAQAQRCVRRVLRRPAPRTSALLVRVQEARHAVAAGSLAPDIPPHVTVLYPFLPANSVDAALERRVAEVAGSFPRFRFRLDRVGRFPGVLYLAPEPASRFVALVHTFARYWPEYPPYAGVYDEVVPHVTAAEGDEAPRLADALAELLPIEATANEVWLMAEQPSGGWRVRGQFPLAGA